MRVFISSVVKGIEKYRDAAEGALRAFAQDTMIPLSIQRSETHAAAAQPSKEICEHMVAESDLVIGIYGSRYGSRDKQTGLSITHLELNWALHTYHKPLLAFLVDAEHPEDMQKMLFDDLLHFRLGVFVSNAASPDELEYELYRALHTNTSRVSLESSLLARYDAIKRKEIYHFIVPLRCTSSLEESRTLTSEADPILKVQVNTLLAEGKPLIFILGEAGSGKTWFMKDLFCNLLERYLERETTLLPLYVDLSQIDFDSSAQSANLEQLALRTQYRIGEYLPPDLPIIQNLGQTVLLLLDGYDEAVAKSTPGAKLQILGKLMSLQSPNVGLVVTSRPQLFETQEHLARFIRLAIYDTHAGKHGQLVEPSLIFIKALRDTDVRAFLRDQFGDAADMYWTKITRTIDLVDLVRRPMLLNMVCDTLGDLSDDSTSEVVTAGYLYRLYTSRWLSREGWRLGFGERATRRFFEELALSFHNSASDSIHFLEIAQRFPDFFPPGLFSAERERIEEALRTATFLTNESGGEYRFVHRSFLEYFLAERILSAILLAQGQIRLDVFPSKVTDGFIQDLLKAETGWQSKLLALLGEATSPVMRYLMAYLANRLCSSEDSVLNPNTLASTIPVLLKSEDDPVVIRELLVSLLSHEIETDHTVLANHLTRPIPRGTLEKELKEYYGSLEEAREYLRGKLWPARVDPLRLFYLISLCGIATMGDTVILEHYASEGAVLEQIVARKSLQGTEVGEEYVD